MDVVLINYFVMNVSQVDLDENTTRLGTENVSF